MGGVASGCVGVAVALTRVRSAVAEPTACRWEIGKAAVHALARRRRALARSLVMLAVLVGAATPVAAAGLDAFGRCLKREGAVFYGTSWCPHCEAQRATLGDAMRHVKYVECAVDGKRGETTAACRKADVASYPTWIFDDDSRESGAQSLEELAAKTGCEPPPTRRPARSDEDESDEQ
jgi:hypothetical protein